MMPREEKVITIGLKSGKVKLTDAEYDIYHQYHKQANMALLNIINSPGYRNLPSEMKAKMLRATYDKFRNAANKRIRAMVQARTLREGFNR